MYFPILRGKQNELIALRELSNEGLLSDKIIPIIEPVAPTSTLKRLLIQFDDNRKKIAVIQNPSIVQYDKFNDAEITAIKSKDDFIPALNVSVNSDFDFSGFSNFNKMIVLNEKSEFDDSKLLNDSILKVVEINNRSALRNLRGDSKLIELHDQFLKQDRNADYLKKDDELFSAEHLYFRQDGYYGFSDYSVIGSDYQTSGFAAKAVAIHLVYFDAKDKLRIHHFVSDTNDNINDPALKAREALEKMMDFISSSSFDNNKNSSMALNEFKRLYKLDKYSGLGYIKKLSIEHHLEIM